MKWLTLMFVVLTACIEPLAPTANTDELTARKERGGEVYTPPAEYTAWWQQVEDCSGITAPMNRITFVQIPPDTLDGMFKCPNYSTGCYGLWFPSHVIWLAGPSPTYQPTPTFQGMWMWGPGVRHEMLHDLLGTIEHPPEYFSSSSGKCGNVVNTDVP